MKTRLTMIGCSLTALLVSCGGVEVIDPATGQTTVVQPAAEIGTAAYNAAREAIPSNPLDLNGWLGAGLAALIAAGSTGATLYLKKKKAGA